MNNLTIAGRLTKDAEVRRTQDGTAVANFTVAVDRYKEGTDFFDCALWRERGEKLAPYLTKGKPVSITGTVSARAYMPRNGGEPQAQMMVSVREVTLLGSKGDSAGNDAPPPNGQGDLDDSEIPF